MYTRRRFLHNSVAVAGASLLSTRLAKAISTGVDSSTIKFGNGELHSLSDGQLQLPLSMLVPDTIDEDERIPFLKNHQIGPDTVTHDCNVTLWRTDERLILFDVGAGPFFPVGGGQLIESLSDAGIDPSEITDVVFTHAHPDHLWGVIDDFDELAFPEAHFHIPGPEIDYWLRPDTLSKTPDVRKSFVVGAQNRLPFIQDRLSVFKWGDEVLPGIEAVDTHGHTPGHTSFMLHADSDSLLIVGDALVNAAISFERPRWPWGSDQDQEAAIQTRLVLLDRLANDKSTILGYHLPSPGVGYVERSGNAYRFIADI
jgi:glyoxylase-like metal-dependent hydrolase (beta-lactamase superfamily II)